jgi:hypothetical protein
VDVRDKQRMPDAEIGKLAMAEPRIAHIDESVALLDQDLDALAAEGIHLLLHETRDRCQIPPPLQFEQPVPEGANGASAERRKMIDCRESKLNNIMQQFDIAVLELEAIFCGHVGDEYVNDLNDLEVRARDT